MHNRRGIERMLRGAYRVQRAVNVGRSLLDDDGIEFMISYSRPGQGCQIFPGSWTEDQWPLDGQLCAARSIASAT